MIRVDPRIGSGEFTRLLVRAGLTDVRKHPLTFGDFCFWGNGREGRVRVGIERKTISEIVSAVGDSRFVGHQLPGLLARYPGHTWLLVEGNYYPDAHSGALKIGRHFAGFGRSAHLYENVEKFLLTLEIKAGVHVKRTNGKTHTAMWLKALYDWYQKPYHQHKSAYKVDETRPEAVMFERRTMKRKVANQLTGLAWTRSVKADVYFPSILSMVVGDPAFALKYRGPAIRHWQQALGFKHGTKIARAIVGVCYDRDEVPGKGKG